MYRGIMDGCIGAVKAFVIRQTHLTRTQPHGHFSVLTRESGGEHTAAVKACGVESTRAVYPPPSTLRWGMGGRRRGSGGSGGTAKRLRGKCNRPGILALPAKARF